MKRRPAGKRSWFSILLIVVAVVAWWLDQRADDGGAAGGPVSAKEGAGAYEVIRGCTLAGARGDDGDSFLVRLPDGRKKTLRLYYVDSPESAFRSYRGGDTNHDRIREQAAQMGGITSEQAVEIGVRAKHFTLDLLGGKPFTVFTRWDSPFRDGRYHAFVEVEWEGGHRWLHELLIARGLARLKTKPADLPDGTTVSKQRDRLRGLERAAKRGRQGAWSMN